MLHALRLLETCGQAAHTAPQVWSHSLVKRLQLERKLEGHDGCVNTVHFSPCGDLLVSGSDDMQVALWDWQLGTRVLSFHSGHHNNVFQARIMPHSGNGTVVTCAADGLVRVAHIPQGCGGRSVETRRLACHRGRAHKLALEPHNPHCFLSCDGEVRHFDLRQPAAGNRRLLACRSRLGRLELNSVHCNPGSSQFCVAGGDPFVRVYDLRRAAPSHEPLAEPVRRLAPWHLRGRSSLISITCAVFSQRGEVLATYNDEDIYRFAAEERRAAPHSPASRRPRSGSSSGGGEGRPTVGRDAGRQRSKRGRSSAGGGSAGGGSGSDGEDERWAAAAGSRAWRQQRREAGDVGQSQRRAAAAAALERQQEGQAASRAVAGAHASIRRSLLEQAGGSEGEAEEPPPAAAADAVAASSAAAASGSRHAEAAGPAWATAAPLGSSAGSQQVQPEAQAAASAVDAAVLAPGSAAPGRTSGAGWGAGPLADDELMEQDGGWQGEVSSEEEEGPGSDGEEEFANDAELPQGALVDEYEAEPSGRRARGADEEEGPSGDGVLQAYKGHRNYRTVKGVSFLGPEDEFVMSGSDCGHVFVWDTQTGAPQAMLKGDADTVNCLEPHPHHLLTLATSGIEDTIKLWAPTAEEPQVLDAAAQRRMAANQRAQGEERRTFISPEILQLLLRARHLEEVSDSEGEEGGGGSGDEGGERQPRHRGECAIS